MAHLLITIFVVVSTQSFLFAIYLAKKGGPGRKPKVLILFTLVLGFHFISLAAGRAIPNYQGYVISWMLLASYGPIIFVYVRVFLNTYKKRDNVNFLIPLYPLMLWLFTDKLHMESSSDTYFDLWTSLPIYSSNIIYLLVGVYMLQATNRTIPNINWVKYLVLSWCFMISFHLTTLTLFSFGHLLFGQMLYIVEAVFMALFTTGLVYTAMSKPSTFINQQKIKELIQSKPKYFYTGLNEDEINNHLSKLELFMKTEKPYRDSEITLIELAEKTGINKRFLSQVINEKLQCNFKEYVNGYRVNDALEILNDPSADFRIFEVMYKVGFNSKSSFNIAFKRKIGHTPSQYRKMIVESSIELSDKPLITVNNA